MSKLQFPIHPCNKETLMKSWAAMPFEFQWQNGKDDCLGPGLISISPQQFNKAFINSR